MDLRVLRYLTAIVRCGGFGKAAEQVHLSQPALSKAIRTLEQELEVRLLERGHRGSTIRLTPAGEVVYRHACILLEQRQQMQAELRSLRQLDSGELRIGLSPLGSAEIFAPIIARFRATYPGIEIHLLERGGAEQEDALRNGEIELATSLFPQDEEIEGMLIRDDPMMVALPQAHPLAALPELHLTDLATIPLVTFEASFALNKLIHDACVAGGFTPPHAAEVTYPDFGLALVAAGTGVMLLPKLIAERHAISGVAIKPLQSSDLRWQPSLIWRKRATLSFAAQALREMIRDSL